MGGVITVISIHMKITVLSLYVVIIIKQNTKSCSSAVNIVFFLRLALNFLRKYRR